VPGHDLGDVGSPLRMASVKDIVKLRFVDRVATPGWTEIPGSVACRLSVVAPAI
jgi:hypothetical protein